MKVHQWFGFAQIRQSLSSARRRRSRPRRGLWGSRMLELPMLLQAPHRWLCSSGPTCGARAGGVRVSSCHCHAVARDGLWGSVARRWAAQSGGHGARPAPFGQSAVQACEQAAMATRGIPGPGLRLSLLEAQSQHKVDPAHARRRRKLHYCCCTALQTEPFDTSCSAVAPERGLITVTASSIAAQ